MARQLSLPPDPIVGNVGTPEVQLAANPFAGQSVSELFGGRQRTRRMGLPGSLTDHEDDRQLMSEPLEVVTVQVLDVRDRIAEIRGVTQLAPTVPTRRVVVAG